MNYYKLKSDGSIEQFTTIPDGDAVPSFIADDFTATDREIIRLHDGTLAFADSIDMDEENKALAEQAEELRIAKLQPTLEERVSANEDALLTQMEMNEELMAENETLRQENESLNDTMLELIEQFETAMSAE